MYSPGSGVPHSNKMHQKGGWNRMDRREGVNVTMGKTLLVESNIWSFKLQRQAMNGTIINKVIFSGV